VKSRKNLIFRDRIGGYYERASVREEDPEPVYLIGPFCLR